MILGWSFILAMTFLETSALGTTLISGRERFVIIEARMKKSFFFSGYIAKIVTNFFRKNLDLAEVNVFPCLEGGEVNKFYIHLREVDASGLVALSKKYPILISYLTRGHSKIKVKEQFILL